MFVFFKQKTAYEMRISDWSSDVCSSDLLAGDRVADVDDFQAAAALRRAALERGVDPAPRRADAARVGSSVRQRVAGAERHPPSHGRRNARRARTGGSRWKPRTRGGRGGGWVGGDAWSRGGGVTTEGQG